MTNNTSDPFGHFSPAKKPQDQRRVTNFLEAFKESAIQHPSQTPAGELRPGVSFSVDQAISLEESRKREEQARQQERLFSQQREEEERARFKANQEQVKRQIEQLREAILKIAKSTHNVSQEIEKAAFDSPVSPGTYHLSFFEKLKTTLEIIKKRLDDSASWLHTMNQRNKRMPFYWSQVKKSGTKYMLSQERYMSTSAG